MATVSAATPVPSDVHLVGEIGANISDGLEKVTVSDSATSKEAELLKECKCVQPASPLHRSNTERSSESGAPYLAVAKIETDDLVVGRSVKTRVLQKINGGAFGVIHLGELLSTGEKVAVKLELQNSPHPQLMSEGNIYRHLAGGPGIPKVHWFGLHEPLYNVMVMDLLGPSLQDLFAYCDHRFSVKTTLMLADQMLEIMEYIHSRQYIHRDIKPDNFMIGLGDNANRVFILDFGLAKKVSPQRFSVGHIGCHVVHPLVGTVRYAGVHAHMGQDEGPRDDLESLGYCWVYFLRGSLPWQGVSARTRDEKFARIHEMKKKTSSAALCEGLPNEFARFLDYVRPMRKDERPDYKRLREAFRKLAADSGYENDNQFDWIKKLQETGEVVLTRIKTGHSHTSS